MVITNIGNVDEWLGHICKTGDTCPIDGYWEQIETGDIRWAEINDKFPELGASTSHYKRAHFKYIGKNKEKTP